MLGRSQGLVDFLQTKDQHLAALGAKPEDCFLLASRNRRDCQGGDASNDRGAWHRHAGLGSGTNRDDLAIGRDHGTAGLAGIEGPRQTQEVGRAGARMRFKRDTQLPKADPLLLDAKGKPQQSGGGGSPARRCGHQGSHVPAWPTILSRARSFAPSACTLRVAGGWAHRRAAWAPSASAGTFHSSRVCRSVESASDRSSSPLRPPSRLYGPGGQPVGFGFQLITGAVDQWTMPGVKFQGWTTRLAVSSVPSASIKKAVPDCA